MKKQFIKLGKISLALLALMVTLSALGVISLPFLGGGVTLAFAAGAGASEVITEPVTTENMGDKSEILKNYVDKNIAKMHPDKYPLDTILREVGVTIPAKSWQVDYFEVETRMLEDTVKTTLSATGTTSPEWTVFELEVNNIHMWAVDDNVLVQGVIGSDSKELMLNVVDMTTTKLKFVAVNGIGTHNADVPEIAANVKLTRAGVAKDELAAQTSPYAVMPQKAYNYNQIHMAQVEQSLYDKLHEKWVEWDLAQYRSEALWDMRAQMEIASLVGYRRKIYNPITKKWKYLSGGAIRFIDKTINKSISGFDNGAFVDITKDIFVGNNGSETRIVFAGSGVMSTFSKAPTFEKQVTQRDVFVKWGIKFNNIETNYGGLLVKYHPILDYMGYSNKAIVLDINNVLKYVYKPMGSTNINFAESGQRNSTADIISEAFCLAFKNPDTHAIINLT